MLHRNYSSIRASSRMLPQKHTQGYWTNLCSILLPRLLVNCKFGLLSMTIGEWSMIFWIYLHSLLHTWQSNVLYTADSNLTEIQFIIEKYMVIIS